MKKLLSLLLTLVFMMGLATPASAAKAKAATMRLQLAEGSVSIRDAAGIPVPYISNMRLYSGYTVSTGDGSSAYILLDDTKAVKLDRNTTVLIKKSGRKLQVKLKAGQLVFNVTAPLDSGENLEIRTSSMVVGIRGSSGVVSLREVIFITGHGVVYSGGKSYAISGGQGFQPRKGVYPAGVSLIPSIYLKEVRDNSRLRDSIRTEGVYDPDTLIAAIPAAEKREEEEYRAALANVMDPSVDDSIVPAFSEEEPAPVSFTVTWMSEGQVLRTDTVEEGETPVYSGQTPTKEADAQNTYTFTGWTPQPGPVTGDVTYTAVFSNTVRSYTITWKNDDGSVIDTYTVAYGDTPSHAAPTKEDTDTASYEFIGWDRPPAAVTGDASYTAVFKATYDFEAIIPQGTNNSPYWVYFPTEGNTPITTAKEGETFTFYVAGGDAADFTVRLNGVVLSGESFYFNKEMDSFVCTFTVPKDPVIEIEPAK